jgi:hypothetical protein
MVKHPKHLLAGRVTSASLFNRCIFWLDVTLCLPLIPQNSKIQILHVVLGSQGNRLSPPPSDTRIYEQ